MDTESKFYNDNITDSSVCLSCIVIYQSMFAMCVCVIDNEISCCNLFLPQNEIKAIANISHMYMYIRLGGLTNSTAQHDIHSSYYLSISMLNLILS